ncbi:MAG: acylphosphatase [Phycisphaerales bacterium]|nr:acylphosphatase [Planctomycetota bacterium]
MSGGPIRVGVRFVGRVQGVGFRAVCRDIACGFPVTGTVRNEADGSVWLEAQGSEEAVGVFIDSILERMGRLVQSHQQSRLAAVAGETIFSIGR